MAVEVDTHPRQKERERTDRQSKVSKLPSCSQYRNGSRINLLIMFRGSRVDLTLQSEVDSAQRAK